MNRRQSDPSGQASKKNPTFFTFSPGDQAVGHSGFDKLLRWAEIDFPANPVYAEPQHLPELRLPDSIVEEKITNQLQQTHISNEPATAIGTSPTSSTSRSRSRKGLERQWIALAQQHTRTPTTVPPPSSSASVAPAAQPKVQPKVYSV